jgi:hypothetical protein
MYVKFANDEGLRSITGQINFEVTGVELFKRIEVAE